MSREPDLVTVFLRWTWWRAGLHRGWWLVTSIYLVVDAGLSPAQLLVIGVAQAATGLVFEVPAGVVADSISRKWSLVVSHALMGSAMIATGLVTDFALLVATQMLWGLAWTFASGADVAWVTDEVDQPLRISGVLVRSGRADLTGAAAGLVAIGALASVVQRSTAMVIAGAAMLLLGVYVVVRFREVRFVPPSATTVPGTGEGAVPGTVTKQSRAATISPTPWGISAVPGTRPARVPGTLRRRWSASWSILVAGFALLRGNRAVLVMVVATFLVNGAATSGRLQTLRLVDIGFPSDPVLWFTGLGVVTLLAGAAAFRVAEARIQTPRATLRGYVSACAIGAVGLVCLAAAPEKVSGSAAVLVVAGIAVPLTRTLGTIWVNQQTGSEIRATVHSFVAQAEYLGVIACGLAIAFVAGPTGLSTALVTCAALFAIAMALVGRLGASRAAGAAAQLRVGRPISSAPTRD